MTSSGATTAVTRYVLRACIFALIVSSYLAFVPAALFSQTSLSQPDNKTLVVDDAPEMEVFAFGKTVIVKRRAKGVLSLGGDVIIEGKVSGEVAAIGGTIHQKKDAFIGGDVIVFGGSYQPEADRPLRTDGKQTVVYAGYEKEMRSLARNPSQVFAPKFSLSFLVQRLLSLCFWFGIAALVTFIAPGAVGRASARLQLSTLKVFAIGALCLVAVTSGVMLSMGFLPGFVSGIIGLMAFVFVMLAYVFGRVVLQARIGNYIVRSFSDKKPSETFSLLAGTLAWTLLLSIPYLWVPALFILFTASLGLVFTSRARRPAWERS